MSASLTGSILDLLGLMPSAAGQSLGVSPLLSWPATPTPVGEGTVATTAGGWDRSTSPNPRVAAFVGPEATLLGVGATVQSWLGTIGTPAGPIPDVVSVTKALMAYNVEALGLSSLVGVGLPPAGAVFPTWQVGMTLVAPIELGSSGAAVTDLHLWSTLSAAYDQRWNGLGDYLPAALPLPDHTADIAWANDQIVHSGSTGELAATVRTLLLGNPSAAVYRVLALLAELLPADQLDLATTLAGDVLQADELSMLATLTPGAIAVRALYRRLASAPMDPQVGAALTALNTALGIPASGAVDLTVTGPSVVPRELAASAAWRIRPDSSHKGTDADGERLDGWHELVLGRAIYCGRTTTFPATFQFSGPAYLGSAGWDAATLTAANEQELNPGGDAMLTARLSAMAAISLNEGRVDAVNMYDRGLISMGVQQWTLHHDNELTLLLWQLLHDHPDEYDAHFGVYGLGLKLTSTNADDASPATVALTEIPPGGSVTDLPAEPDNNHIAAARLGFFEGYQIDAHHFTWIKPGDTTARSPWAARVRNAERCSHSFTLIELLTAAARFTRILREDQGHTVQGQSFPISVLLTSEHAAAQLLDQHINAPGHVATDVKRAIAANHTTPVLGTDGKPASQWLTVLDTLYQAKVRYGPGVDKNARIAVVNNANLSTTPGSFGGWPP